jgi:hypothetical protein
MVPHERGLEVVVIAMPVHRVQLGHTQQKPGQCIQQIVVQIQVGQILAEGQSEGNGGVLETVVREAQHAKVGQTTDVGWERCEGVTFEGEHFDGVAFENLCEGK